MVDMFEWKHPNYYKKIKKENRLTKDQDYDKEDDNEKIQSKNIRTRNRRNSNNTTRQRTNDRADRE
jgi:hypothetical protein